MNVSSPKAYTIPGVDLMQAAITPPPHLTPLHLAPVGAKAVDLDFDGGRLSSPTLTAASTFEPVSQNRSY